MGDNLYDLFMVRENEPVKIRNMYELFMVHMFEPNQMYTNWRKMNFLQILIVEAEYSTSTVFFVIDITFSCLFSPILKDFT